MSQKFQDQLSDFIVNGSTRSYPESKWFRNAKLKVYLRSGAFVNAGFLQYDSASFSFSRCLVVSNIDVLEKYRMKGVYSKLLTDLEEMNTFEFISIENANPDHDGIYQRRGFILKTPQYESDRQWFKRNPRFKNES